MTCRKPARSTPGVPRDARRPGADASDGSVDAKDGFVEASTCSRTQGQSGEFLITLSMKPFPEKPNLMKATIDFVDADSMILTLQFLDYDRVDLVGTPVVTDPIRLRSDGSFGTGLLRLEIPGTAHCALPDTPILVDLALEGGVICDDTTFACGTANGSIVALGIDLNGSTFTAQRITNGQLPEPILNCARSGVVSACK